MRMDELKFDNLTDLANFIREHAITGWKNYFTETVFDFDNSSFEPPEVIFLSNMNTKNIELIESILKEAFPNVPISKIFSDISPWIIRCFVRKTIDKRFAKSTGRHNKSNLESQLDSVNKLVDSFNAFKKSYLDFSSKPLFEEIYQSGQNFSELGNSLLCIDEFLDKVKTYDREKLKEIFKKDFYVEDRRATALYLGQYFYNLFLQNGSGKLPSIKEWYWIENHRVGHPMEPQEFTYNVGLQIIDFFEIREGLTIKGIKNLKESEEGSVAPNISGFIQSVHYSAYPNILPELMTETITILKAIHQKLESESIHDQTSLKRYRIMFYEMAKDHLDRSPLDCRQSLEIVSVTLSKLKQID